MQNHQENTPLRSPREVQVEMPPAFNDHDLLACLSEKFRCSDFSFRILRQSLDCRTRGKPRWILKVALIPSGSPDSCPAPRLDIPHANSACSVLVVGSGPAGLFASLALSGAGVNTTLLERGPEVGARGAKIRDFESGGTFHQDANYAFGEGGAGAFSDGKLTSRTKRISSEREYVLHAFVDAGAPQEILRLAHPHVGSDNLVKVVRNIRNQLVAQGVNILFNTTFQGFTRHSGRFTGAITSAGDIHADYLLLACGQNSVDTYKNLLSSGLLFAVKPFAVGFRAEHPQRLINQAQWGAEDIPGLKAAEYRLACRPAGLLPVYSFCMCPGGRIIPAAPSRDVNIVNGMSMYSRNGDFANAGIVAAVHPDMLAKHGNSTPEQALDALHRLENSFLVFSGSFQAPYCPMNDFLSRRMPSSVMASSYPLGLFPAPLWKMLPEPVAASISAAIEVFDRQVRHFRSGSLVGLESKTSSPLQAIRDLNCLCDSFSNIFFAGEGSGHAGGIVSSAADGIRAASGLLNVHNSNRS